MSGLVQYEDADLKNRVNVSETAPLPVSAPLGLAIADPAFDGATETSLPTYLQQVVMERDAFGGITLERATDGTVTIVADEPSIAGETEAWERETLRLADGSFVTSTLWTKLVL